MSKKKLNAFSLTQSLPPNFSYTIENKLVVLYELDENGRPIFGNIIKENQWIRQKKLEKITKNYE